MVAFAMTAFFACGDKDNGNGNGGGTDIEESTDYMHSGVFEYSNITDDDWLGTYNLQLVDESDVFQYSISKPGDDNDHIYMGNYKYSNATQKGTVELSEYMGPVRDTSTSTRPSLHMAASPLPSNSWVRP